MEKYFTVDEAHRALTLIRPIVQDILSKMKRAQEIQENVKLTKSQLMSDRRETELLTALRQAEQLLNEIEYHIKELEGVGVLLRDLNCGLVDFPCLHDGRVVYLCWRIDESSINFWHELESGFAGRKTIDVSFRVTTNI